jgi:hypothetical protein
MGLSSRLIGRADQPFISKGTVESVDKIVKVDKLVNSRFHYQHRKCHIPPGLLNLRLINMTFNDHKPLYYRSNTFLSEVRQIMRINLEITLSKQMSSTAHLIPQPACKFGDKLSLASYASHHENW